jgi:hypothetical protein
MDDKLTSVAYSTFINKGAMALLIGSGVSRESGIPTGWEITLDLIKQIGIIQGVEEMVDPEEWYKSEFGSSPDYSDILNSLTHSPEERINLLRKYFEPSEEEFEEDIKTASKAHAYIAQLIRSGYIRVIVTTNFDRLLENAIKELGIEPTVISNPNHVESALPLIHSRVTIIKLNGDYLDTGFLNLKSELDHFDPRIETLLTSVFENFGLITCGWSGKWDLALLDALKRHQKFRFPNFYTFMNRNEELSSLSESRRGYLLPIKGASDFFHELYENVIAIERIQGQHALTDQIVISRVKKYVSRPELIVDLNDLILELSASSFEKLEFPPIGQSRQASIGNQMEMCFSQIKLLGEALAEGVYWSKKDHYQIWLNVAKLSMDLHKNYPHSHYVDETNIRNLPCLILRYVIGMAGLASSKYDLIIRLFELSNKEHNQKRYILEQTYPHTVIDHDLLRKIMGKNYFTPMSEKLYEYLKPLFVKILPTDSQFNEVFEMYELIAALVFMTIKDRGFQYGPLGRFCHQNERLIPEVHERLEQKGEEYILVSCGLFEDYRTFKEILESYQKMLSTRSWHI